VTPVRPDPHPVVIRDAAVAADYVASLGDHFTDEVARPWPDVVREVREQVQAVISAKGAFMTSGDPAAFVGQCRRSVTPVRPAARRAWAGRAGTSAAA
jgi:hypothetical protein